MEGLRGGMDGGRERKGEGEGEARERKRKRYVHACITQNFKFAVFGSNSENSDLQIVVRQKASSSWAQKKQFVQDRTRCKRTRDT